MVLVRTITSIRTLFRYSVRDVDYHHYLDGTLCLSNLLFLSGDGEGGGSKRTTNIKCLVSRKFFTFRKMNDRGERREVIVYSYNSNKERV